jgi:hypothetical protein
MLPHKNPFSQTLKNEKKKCQIELGKPGKQTGTSNGSKNISLNVKKRIFYTVVETF